MTRVLVTGGAGFIGSAVVRYLLHEVDAEVCVYDKFTYAGHRANLGADLTHPNLTIVTGDICDRSLLRQAFDNFRPTVIMHLAAESHVDRSISGPSAFIQTNIVGTFELLEVAREYWESLRSKDFLLHHVSTDEVYGSLGTTGVFLETTPYDPSSPYSASKAASDHIVRAWHRTYGLPVVLTNCSNNYGPFQYPEKLIPMVITQALLGQAIPIYGNGENVRDWLYVDDHARALWHVVQHGARGETYNVGTRAEKRNIDLVRTLCTILDELRPRERGSYTEQITFVPDRKGHDLRYAIDPQKLEALGWLPRESFDSGIRKTVQWYLDHTAWCQEVTGKTGTFNHQN